jgi:L-ascorbate metabolism protein UlaG (beta-lactamase superfamily)
MIKPVLQGEAFLADVRQAAAEKDKLHLWWLGQSCYLIQWQQHHLLLDPYLSDSLTQKYAGTAQPHVRMTERVVAPEQLNFIRVVTSSHNHTDHLDGETLRPLLQANPNLTLLVSEANRRFAADRLQVSPERLTGLIEGRPRSFGPFTFQAVPAAHEALEMDENGHYKFIGLVIRVGPWTLYHSGDTVRYEGMVKQLRQWPIDLAFLPINGRDPARGVAGNLSGIEAVELAQAIGVRLVIPCHYEMFQFNTVSPETFIAVAETMGQPYRLLKCGERYSLAPEPR